MPKQVNPETGKYDKNLPAHHVVKGDPRINGPYLDDIRAAEEDARREMRRKGREALDRVPRRDNERELKNARAAAVEVQKDKNQGNSVDNPTPVKDTPESKTPTKKTAAQRATAKKTAPAKKATSGKKASDAGKSNK